MTMLDLWDKLFMAGLAMWTVIAIVYLLQKEKKAVVNTAAPSGVAYRRSAAEGEKDE